MMKRLTALLLTLGTLLALSGCRTPSERQAIRSQLDNASGKTEYTAPGEPLADGTTLAEQTVYDENGITLTALGLYTDEYGDDILSYSLYNGQTTEVYLSVDSVTVNGWTMGTDVTEGTVVTPGGLEYGTIELSRDEALTDELLGSISAVRLWGEIYYPDPESPDDSGWIRTPLDCTLTASNSSADAGILPDGTVVYEDGQVTILSLGAQSNGAWDYSVALVAVNHTENSVELYTNGEEGALTLNGQTFPDDSAGGLAAYPKLAPESRTMLTVYFDWDSVRNLGLTVPTEVTSVTLPLTMWPMADEAQAQPVCLTLEGDALSPEGDPPG